MRRYEAQDQLPAKRSKQEPNDATEQEYPVQMINEQVVPTPETNQDQSDVKLSEQEVNEASDQERPEQEINEHVVPSPQAIQDQSEVKRSEQESSEQERPEQEINEHVVPSPETTLCVPPLTHEPSSSTQACSRSVTLNLTVNLSKFLDVCSLKRLLLRIVILICLLPGRCGG